MDSQVTGLNLGLKFDPINLSLVYAKIDESGATTDSAALGTEDIDIYAVNASFALAGFDSNAFGAMQTDDTAAQAEPWALGLMTSGTLGMVNILAELDVLGGDAAAVDYTGLNFYLKGDAAINDMFTVGAEILYGDGDDTDTQITGETGIHFTPFSIGTPMDGWITAFAGSPFDMIGQGAGTIGATIFFSSTPMEKLSLGGKFGMFETEEDSVVDADLTAFNAWVAMKSPPTLKCQ